MGIRFAMFAAPVLCLGVLVPADGWLARRSLAGRVGVFSSSALFTVALVVGIPLIQRAYARLPIETVLTREHAAALRSLRSEAASEGLVWTWSDYGYATQYFAGLPPLADGGRHGGDRLFTLGGVLGSDNPAASARLMAYSAAQGGTPWKSWKAWEGTGIGILV